MPDRIYLSPRFYGGHYDTVKQGYVREALNCPDRAAPWQPQLVERYTARLRLDMLFAGNVILTDSQFYDGIFFHEMVAEENSRNDFINFLRITSQQTSPLLEVRRRPNGLLGIISKPFKFSSITSDKLSQKISSSMTNALSERSQIGAFSDVNAAFKAFANCSEDSDVKITIKDLAEKIQYLDNMPSGIFRNWDSARKLTDGFILAKEEYKYSNKGAEFQVPRWGNKEIDEVLEKIDLEMQQALPNRSKIDKLIKEGKETNPTYIDYISGLYGACNKIFNRAFAYQHICNSMDLGDAPINLGEFGEPFDLLSPQLIEDLGTESWKEFLNRITHEPIKTPWQNWRNLINQEKSQKEIKKAAQSLVDSIQKDYRFTPMRRLVEIIGGGSTDAVISTNGLSFQPSLGTVITLAINLPETISAVKQAYKDRSNLLKYGLSISLGN